MKELGEIKVVKEEAILEKFNADEVLVERITLLNGEVVNHEHFPQGNEEGGVLTDGIN